MAIFNSLGSNYSLDFVKKAVGLIVFKPKDLIYSRLEKEILKRVSGEKVFFFYKGRDAIEAAVRLAGLTAQDTVLTQAFTCFAIEEALVRAGVRVEYVDIDSVSWNPTVEGLEAKRKKNSAIKAVLIQHTLGRPAAIKEIRQWCDKHDLVLIEDLASAVGGVDADGTPLGTYGHFIVLSFGRDKVLDAVSGGCLVSKNQQSTINNQIDDFELMINDLVEVPRTLVVKDLSYPLITWLIRTTYDFGLGKVIATLAKQLGWLSSPVISPLAEMAALPVELAELALCQLKTLDEQIAHRRMIAQEYARALEPLNQNLGSSYVRYSMRTTDPRAVVSRAKARGIHIADRWYRSPVDSGSLGRHSVYTSGSCQVAEELAQEVINLPTHRFIQPGTVQTLLECIFDK